MEQISKRLMSWASIIEPDTLEQAGRTAGMPFIHPHVALMPDAHLGKGATVGSVIPTEGAIMPAAIGVDIGCGMRAVRTGIVLDSLEVTREDWRVLRKGIEEVIPLSPGKYNEYVYDEATQYRIDRLEALAGRWGIDPSQHAGNWAMQLGSLGGGNHFIEVSADNEGVIWLFLHSGSRGVGNKIATHHIKAAKKFMDAWYISLPDPDLAYLIEGTAEFWQYINAMKWAQEFAYLNREEMMSRVMAVFDNWLGDVIAPTLAIDCHHNYTQRETHFGKSVWISRKGAISAQEGEWGLIPGSMGTRSYVVKGLGNKLALNSAPHGAGRVFSRTKARKTFTQDDLRDRMGDIEYRDSEAFVDEIPDAYKDIDQVMLDAEHLVVPEYELRQLVNVKGE